MSSQPLARWQEVRETLATLLAWLDETQQWSQTAAAEQESVSAPAEPVIAGNDTPPAEGSTGEDDLASQASAANPDLFALLSVLTALRQEVKLHTRSARHDREQAAQTLSQLSQAVDHFESLRQTDAQHYAGQVEEAERSVVETFVDLHDALSRTAQQSERVIASVVATLRQWSTQLLSSPLHVEDVPESEAPTTPAAPAPSLHRRGVRGWFRRGVRSAPPPAVNTPHSRSEERAPSTPAAELLHALQQVNLEADRMAARLEGLAEGYRLNMQRLERVLAAYDIEPIASLGRPVDAELMEVVQLADDSSQPPGVVVEEIRRGYRRGSRIYRFAQVVATREASSATEPLPDTNKTPEA